MRISAFLLALVALVAGTRSALLAQTDENLPAILTSKPLKPLPGDSELRKLLIARYNAAVAVMNARYQEYMAGRGSFDVLAETGKRVVDSGLEVYETHVEKLALLEKYLELARAVEKSSEGRYANGRCSIADLEQTRYSRLDAEILVYRLKHKAVGPKRR